jgi:hypothetical protein
VKFGILVFCCLFCGCSYHFQEEGSEVKTISVPYIKGDSEGELAQMLVRALSASGRFECVQTGGEWILEVALVGNTDDRIGYRYDRDATTGHRRTNIVGTENRHTILAEVKLIDAYTQEILIGPQIVKGLSDYDYVDSNSIVDLTFSNPGGKPETVLDFSLGQLDSIEGAHDDSALVSYQDLVSQILNGLF